MDCQVYIHSVCFPSPLVLAWVVHVPFYAVRVVLGGKQSKSINLKICDYQPIDS